MSADSFHLSRFTEGLPQPEATALYSILRLYTGGSLASRIRTSIREVDNLMNVYHVGYRGPSEGERSSPLLKQWRKSLQAHIEKQPLAGRDRLAIALACFRDFVTGKDPSRRWEDIEECRRQLLDLYTVTITPFKI